jgi:hypothetical protein
MTTQRKNDMRFTRKLAWTVTPLVALSLGVGGFAVASWHSATEFSASGTMAVLQPVTATATLQGPMFPGDIIKLDVHFNNPNRVPVNVVDLEANNATYTVARDNAGNWIPDTIINAGRTFGDPATQFGGTFDVKGGAYGIPSGNSHRVLTGPVLDPAFGATLAQGSTITFIYHVTETAF